MIAAAPADTPPHRPTRGPRPILMKLADEVLIAFLRLRLAEQHVPPALRDGRVLRPPDAAVYLGLTEKALWYQRRHQLGPTYVRLGDRNAVGYRVADLDEWLLARSVKPGTETARRPKRRPTGA